MCVKGFRSFSPVINICFLTYYLDNVDLLSTHFHSLAWSFRILSIYVDCFFLFSVLFCSDSLQTGVSSVCNGLLVQLGCVYAAKRLHTFLLVGVLHAPLSYFDQTPTGRILQRFNSDTEVVDNEFAMLIEDLLYCALEVISQTSILTVNIRYNFEFCRAYSSKMRLRMRLSFQSKRCS